jgi:ribonuclease E
MMSAEMLRDEDPSMDPAARADAPPGAEAQHEEGQGRRRRRRGGRGRDRNGERPPREGFPGEASPADAIESRAAELEEARAPVHEAVDATSHQNTHARHEAREPQRDHDAPRHEPVAPAMAQAPAAPTFAPLAAPVAFREVSQHDESGDEAQSHRPQRRRRHGAEPAEQPQQLQLVETQAESFSDPPAEDDLPRRTRPRRRRSHAAVEEPLQIVETQPGSQQDGAPTP